MCNRVYALQVPFDYGPPMLLAQVVVDFVFFEIYLTLVMIVHIALGQSYSLSLASLLPEPDPSEELDTESLSSFPLPLPFSSSVTERQISRIPVAKTRL